MKKKYTKLPLDYQQQIQMLKDRGLTIADEAEALNQLKIISYFRLASYLRPMEQDKATHQFKPGATFENAVALYYFDKELRALLFTAIQSIEIALRTKVIHTISLKYGAFWYTESSLCANTPMFAANLSRIVAEVNRSKEDFIQDHFAAYSDAQLPPAWKTFEVISLGTLSKLYENHSDRQLKKTIAAEFNLPHRKFLESWLKCICALRNAIAHHARIWNRRFPYKPLRPSHLPADWAEMSGINPVKLYPLLCALQYLQNAIHPENTFATDFKALLRSPPPPWASPPTGSPSRFGSNFLLHNNTKKCNRNIEQRPKSSVSNFWGAVHFAALYFLAQGDRERDKRCIFVRLC